MKGLRGTMEKTATYVMFNLAVNLFKYDFLQESKNLKRGDIFEKNYILSNIADDFCCDTSLWFPKQPRWI